MPKLSRIEGPRRLPETVPLLLGAPIRRGHEKQAEVSGCFWHGSSLFPNGPPRIHAIRLPNILKHAARFSWPFLSLSLVSRRLSCRLPNLCSLIGLYCARPPLSSCRVPSVYPFACPRARIAPRIRTVLHVYVIVPFACYPRVGASLEKGDEPSDSPSLARADWTTIIIAVSTVGFVLLLIVNIVIVSCLCVRRRKKRMEEGELHDARTALSFYCCSSAMQDAGDARREPKTDGGNVWFNRSECNRVVNCPFYIRRD